MDSFASIVFLIALAALALAIFFFVRKLAAKDADISSGVSYLPTPQERDSGPFPAKQYPGGAPEHRRGAPAQHQPPVQPRSETSLMMLIAVYQSSRDMYRRIPPENRAAWLQSCRQRFRSSYGIDLDDMIRQHDPQGW
jgi:hypothetical protein